MTHCSGKEAIKKECVSGIAANVQFHYFGNHFKYHQNRLLARLQSWLVYRSWQAEMAGNATKLHRQHGFAVAHHVTYATWRVPSELWRLSIPFVFGPVGGGSSMPTKFRKMLGPTARTFELLRDTATRLALSSPALKLCCSRSSAVVAADRQTASFLAAQGAKSVRTLCQVFFTEHQVSRFTQHKRPVLRDGSALRIFAGGNLEARKGIILTLQALARLKKSGIPFKYVYGGGGPERNSMVKLAADLGIANEVFFHNGFEGIDYESQLAQSDIYLLPSVRETAGITMMEAILAGCFPIVLSGTGAGDIVENTGGVAIQAKSPDEAIEKIAGQLQWCHHHRVEMQYTAAHASIRMRSLFSESAYKQAICEIYTEAIERHTGEV
jgi:glycosyltransferase involved in cell wall biosynthesis